MYVWEIYGPLPYITSAISSAYYIYPYDILISPSFLIFSLVLNHSLKELEFTIAIANSDIASIFALALCNERAHMPRWIIKRIAVITKKKKKKEKEKKKRYADSFSSLSFSYTVDLHYIPRDKHGFATRYVRAAIRNAINGKLVRGEHRGH